MNEHKERSLYYSWKEDFQFAWTLPAWALKSNQWEYLRRDVQSPAFCGQKRNWQSYSTLSMSYHSLCGVTIGLSVRNSCWSLVTLKMVLGLERRIIVLSVLEMKRIQMKAPRSMRSQLSVILALGATVPSAGHPTPWVPELMFTNTCRHAHVHINKIKLVFRKTLIQGL